MKYYFFFFIIVLGVLRASAQSIESYTHAIDFLPPPPNATAIMKHDALTISKNTGSPNIHIPLMPLKGVKLNLGASISYASTGLKVDEIASRVGMGWTIQLGGVVTRTVRGAPDEKTTRLTPPSFTQDCGTYNYFMNATADVAPNDTEPDYFTFSMNGLSGSFVLDDSMNPVILSGQKYKVETNFLTSAAWNFKITDDQGIAYYFGGTNAVEKTKRQSTCGPRNFTDPLPVSWYLIKIQHPNGETMSFGYQAITYSYDTGYSETQQWKYLIAGYDLDDPTHAVNVDCPDCNPVSDSYCVSKVTTNGVKLSTVSSSAGYSMAISYTSRTDCNDQLIDGLFYYGPDGTTIGSYGLFYDMVQSNLQYANANGTNTGYDKTPYLKALSEYAAGGAAVNEHLFTYITPTLRAPRLSLAQDHWGYFNGVASNHSFIPTPSTTTLITDFPRATANREPQEQYAKMGMLCKVQYPTGGSDTIIYESNKQTTAVAQPTHVFYGQTTGSGDHTNIITNYTLNIPTAQNVTVHFTCDSTGFIDHLHNVGDLTITGGGTTITHQTLAPGQSLDMNFTLGGTYNLAVQANGATVTSRAIVTYHASTLSGAVVDVPTAGVRVKTIITSTQGQPAQVRNFYYGELSTMNTSSLVNVPVPVYNVNTKTPLTCQLFIGGGTGTQQDYGGYCTGIAMHSNSQRNLYDFSGSPISYYSVIESIGPNFQSGGIQTRFYVEHDAAGQMIFGRDIPNATYSNFSINYNGKTREETILKKAPSGALVPVKTTLYTFKSDTAGTRIISGYAVQKDYNKTEQVIGCSPPNSPILATLFDPFSAVRYDIMAPWVYNDTVTVKTFDVNGLNPIISTTVSKYENTAHRQLTYRQTNTSDGHLDVTRLKYPADYSSTPVYASMIAANIISPILDMTTYKDTAKMAEQKINYADWGNGNYAMASAQSSFYSAPLVTDGTIDSYNKYGSITQYTGKDKLTTAILWGGKRGQYPVAKIAGATYASAVSNLGVADTALYTMSEASTRTQIDLVRAALPNAQVTTYTYKQKVGVTSITDPRDNMSSYAYDYKDRLNSIFDVNGNIVKNYSYNFGIPTPDNTTGWVGNDYMQNSFTAASCEPGFTALAINYGIAANTFFGATKTDANSAAAAALAVQGQSYANQFSTCTHNAQVYWNVEQILSFQKSDCGPNYTGTMVSDTVKAHSYSGVTQYDADQLALYNLNQGGQTYANAHGSCNPNCTTGNCTGNDKKCVNGVCETGQKVYTSSVQDHGSLWTCTYHYHWSDGTNSVDYTETSSSQCFNVEE